MKLFATAEAIRSEIDAMVGAETDRREDRATVSAFFNGEPPLTAAEAEDMGITVNVNNLFGFSEISDAKGQLFSLYTKPTRLYSIELDAAPAPVRARWQRDGSAEFNAIVRDTGRLKPAYEGVSGDAGLHGVGVFTFPDKTDWCPSQTSLSKLLVPDDTPTDLNKVTHWAIETELQLNTIHDHLRLKRKDWKYGTLRALVREIYKGLKDGALPTAESESYNAEELEYQRQLNAGSGSVRKRPTVRVFYFYQVRCDKPGRPIDLTILLHANELLKEGSDDEKKGVLYEKECYFDAVEEAIHPFFMDCTVGGVPMWHRSLGLGHLNYQLNHAVELLINRAMQGTLEGMMNLWQAKDSANREQIQQVLLRHNGVVPEGVNLLAQRFNPDFSGTLGMIQFFRQQGSRNARRSSDATGDRLEVEALWAQSDATQANSTRTSNWYDYLDRLGREMWARMVNPFITSKDAGYSEIMKFQSRMKRLGVPLYYLQPWNVKVSATRILADGNSQQARTSALWLTQNRAMFGPKAQQRITQIATAEMTGSYSLAEELAPDTDQPDTSQLLDAQTESNICLVQGRPPEVTDRDIDELHVPEHLNAMSGVVQQAAQFGNATFTPEQFLGFQALGAHVVKHIRKKESMVGAGRGDANKAMASEWMQALNEVASVGEKMANNLQQKMQGGQEKPDPIEVAKLQLAAEQLRISREKFDFSREKWSRQQEHKESTSAFNQMLSLERDRREGMMARNKAAANDVSGAVKLKQLAAPQPAGA